MQIGMIKNTFRRRVILVIYGVFVFPVLVVLGALGGMIDIARDTWALMKDCWVE